MNIIENDLAEGVSLKTRPVTNQIIIHYSESPDVPAATIQEWHRARGFSMIGYHYVVHPDGRIERGRPEWAVGAHAIPANWNGIGICFPGNFNNGVEPTQAALNACGELVREIRSRYGDLPVKRHGDVDDTDCPGDSFPWEKLLQAVSATGPVPSSNAVKVNIMKDGGKILYLDGAMQGDRVQAPLRAVAETMGGKLDWDENLLIATVEPDLWTIELDGAKLPGIISLDKGFVGVRELAAYLGRTIDYQGDKKTIVLK